MAKLSTKAVLSEIRNWEELAGRAKYHCGELAKLCGVSVKSLERFFHQRMRITPQQWLWNVRRFEAERLVRAGMRTKEIADRLAYSCPACFCREYKKRVGISIRMWVEKRGFIGAKGENEIRKMSKKANQLVLSEENFGGQSRA